MEEVIAITGYNVIMSEGKYVRTEMIKDNPSKDTKEREDFAKSYQRASDWVENWATEEMLFIIGERAGIPISKLQHELTGSSVEAGYLYYEHITEKYHSIHIITDETGELPEEGYSDAIIIKAYDSWEDWTEGKSPYEEVIFPLGSDDFTE